MSDDLRSEAASAAGSSSASAAESAAGAAPAAGGPRRVALGGARLPADHGLSSLGLLMQLGGSVFVALGALLSLTSLAAVGPRHGAGWSMLMLLGLGVVSVARSVAHRMAGSAILYGTAPGLAIRRYFQLAAVQTVAVAAFFAFVADVPLGATLTFVAALAAWPLTLAVTLRAPRLSGLLDAAVPVGEDKGFEGAAVLMVLLGLCGCAGTLLLLISVARMPSRGLDGTSVLLVVLLGLLVIRSVLHVHAGLRGMRALHLDRAVEAAARYTDFAVIMSFVAGGLLLLFTMMTRAGGADGILTIGVVTGLLLVWPLALRRFFSERQFADLLAAEQAPLHRRAPDQGLTALGWLLLALAGTGLAVSVPAALGLGPTDVLSPLARLLGGHSPWWTIGMSGLQLWAGLELVRMGDHHRIAATIYGVVSAATILFLFLPVLRNLESLGALGMSGAGGGVLAVIALTMVVPVAAVLLVNRAHVPVARATIRSRAA